jgi:hypothetical protein
MKKERREKEMSYKEHVCDLMNVKIKRINRNEEKVFCRICGKDVTE